MGMAEYIAKKFMGEEIWVDLDDEAETVVYSEVWAKNREIIRGIVRTVEEGVLEFEIPTVGVIYINCDCIKVLWKPGIDWRKATKGSFTNRLLSANRR